MTDPADQDQQFNPFQAPAPFDRRVVGIGSADAEAIRMQHLSAEASIRSMGTLHLLGGCLCLFLSAATVLSDYQPTPLWTVALPGLTVLEFLTAFGLRRFRVWSRLPAAIISGVGLFVAFPWGLFLNGLLLYELFNPRSRFVFSAEYQQVIEQTPYIKHSSPVLTWGLITLLMAALSFVIGMVLFGW